MAESIVGELAAEHLWQYAEDETTVITAVSGDIDEEGHELFNEINAYALFETSDGKHWLLDVLGNYPTAECLIGRKIAYDEDRGWLADGQEIEWDT